MASVVAANFSTRKCFLQCGLGIAVLFSGLGGDAHIGTASALVNVSNSSSLKEFYGTVIEKFKDNELTTDDLWGVTDWTLAKQSIGPLEAEREKVDPLTELYFEQQFFGDCYLLAMIKSFSLGGEFGRGMLRSMVYMAGDDEQKFGYGRKCLGDDADGQRLKSCVQIRVRRSYLNHNEPEKYLPGLSPAQQREFSTDGGKTNDSSWKYGKLYKKEGILEMSATDLENFTNNSVVREHNKQLDSTGKVEEVRLYALTSALAVNILERVTLIFTIEYWHEDSEDLSISKSKSTGLKRQPTGVFNEQTGKDVHSDGDRIGFLRKHNPDTKKIDAHWGRMNGAHLAHLFGVDVQNFGNGSYSNGTTNSDWRVGLQKMQKFKLPGKIAYDEHAYSLNYADQEDGTTAFIQINPWVASTRMPLDGVHLPGDDEESDYYKYLMERRPRKFSTVDDVLSRFEMGEFVSRVHMDFFDAVIYDFPVEDFNKFLSPKAPRRNAEAVHRRQANLVSWMSDLMDLEQLVKLEAQLESTSKTGDLDLLRKVLLWKKKRVETVRDENDVRFVERLYYNSVADQRGISWMTWLSSFVFLISAAFLALGLAAKRFSPWGDIFWGVVAITSFAIVLMVLGSSLKYGEFKQLALKSRDRYTAQLKKRSVVDYFENIVQLKRDRS